MTISNRKFLLASRPKGMPGTENFKMITSDLPPVKEGEVLIRSIYLSVDPYMRGRMRGVKTYVEPYRLHEVLTGGVVGEVAESRNASFKEGEIVEGRLDWADFSISNGENIRRVNPDLAPISTALGAAGMPGLTAYFGMLDIGRPKTGETVVVSGAAGAVGSVSGQLAKMKGCRLVGIAGSAEKTDYLKNDLGFDATINYKTENVRDALKTTCPNGVDIYFDNVGGEISDAVIEFINFHSRIVLCGQISTYNLEKPALGPRIQGQLIHRSALMKGFIVRDYADRFEEGYTQLGNWINDGTLKYRENIIEGLENAPQAFIGLFLGENVGKQLIKL
ncbi:NADP-dependent oxidoreductase [Virgibacillus kimchii]